MSGNGHSGGGNIRDFLSGRNSQHEAGRRRVKVIQLKTEDATEIVAPHDLFETLTSLKANELINDFNIGDDMTSIWHSHTHRIDIMLLNQMLSEVPSNKRLRQSQRRPSNLKKGLKGNEKK